MNIIKRILSSIFLKDDDEEFDYSNDDKLDEVKKIYDDGQRKLKKSKQSYQNYDPNLIPVFQEYERQKVYKIRFEFCPKYQNYRNVRSASWFKYGTYHTWTEIRNLCEKRAGNLCVVCGKSSYDYQHLEPEKKITTNTEAHENWIFDEHTRIQKLYKISSLCFVCHQICHINMHKKDDVKFNMLLKRYASLNKIRLERAYEDFHFAEKEKLRRENIKYSLDMRYINKLGLDCEFDKYFDCHTQEFHSFLELKFKNSKHVEEDDE